MGLSHGGVRWPMYSGNHGQRDDSNRRHVQSDSNKKVYIALTKEKLVAVAALLLLLLLRLKHLSSATITDISNRGRWRDLALGHDRRYLKNSSNVVLVF